MGPGHSPPAHTQAAGVGWTISQFATPMVFVLDAESKVANKTISSNLRDLEATLDGMGRPQGGREWISDTADNGVPPDGGVQQPAGSTGG